MRMMAGEEARGGLSRHVRAGEAERLEIALGQYSSAGAKPENQDFFGALEPEGADRVTKGIALAIADGISTSRVGAEAAEIAVKSFLTDYYCTSAAWSVRNAGERVIAATNSWMHAQNGRIRPREEGEDRERGALICAFSALVLKGAAAHLFHVGDARIALLARGRLEPLTEAHTVRVDGKSYLGRALGVNRAVEIDYRQVPVQVGDLFMLSTDGVHEFVSNAQAVALIERAGDLDAAARAIAEAARDNGSGDNLTVQLVRIEAVPSGEVGDLLGAELRLPPAPQLRAGELFEGYTVLRELHSGSRSHVYLARDEADGRLVALKVPATDQTDNEGGLAALLIEEWVMRRVSHPNLLGAAPRRGPRGHIYSVAPYVEARTLEQWMRDNPKPSLQQVRDIVGQIASGLLALHRREMLHRDLKPGNVLVDAEGTVRIIDFGSVEVAGLDEIGAGGRPAIFAGAIQYAAPELFAGEPASRRSDLFSLGVIAYQMLTGALPYGSAVAAAASSGARWRLRYRSACEHDPELPRWVDAALAKAVAVDPARRYGELSEFTYDLAHPGREFDVAAPRPLLERGTRRFWRNAALLLALALAIALLSHPAVGVLG